MKPVCIVDEVEANPEEAKGFPEGSGGISEEADMIILAINQQAVVVEEGSIALYLQQGWGI